MIKAVEFAKPIPYTSLTEEELPEDERSVFMIQYPGMRLMEKIDNESVELIMDGDKAIHKIKSGTQKYTILLNCLKDWKNVIGENGKPVSFDATSPDAVEKCLNMLPLSLRDELYNELRGNQELNKNLRKKKEEKEIKEVK